VRWSIRWLYLEHSFSDEHIVEGVVPFRVKGILVVPEKLSVRVDFIEPHDSELPNIDPDIEGL